MDFDAIFVYSCMRNRHTIYPGQTYGDYVAIEAIKYTTKNNTVEKQWKCIDSEGNVRYFRARVLTTLKSSEENAKLHEEEMNDLVNNNKHQHGVRNKYYSEYKKNAPMRGHSFELTFEEFNSIIVQNCHYCGKKPQYNPRWVKIEHKDQPKFLHNGVDRIDSSKGYTVKNTVPCCSKCNLMKNVMSAEEFLEHVFQISNFNKQSSTTIPKGSTLQANGSGSAKHLDKDDDIV